MVWIEGSEEHTQELIRRFDKEPKPMSYHPAFLNETWTAYLNVFNVAPDKVDPDDFIRWALAKALDHRQPRYRAMAEKWGLTIPMDRVAEVHSEEGFIDMIAEALEKRA